MPRFQNLDALRGLAAMVVLFQHLLGHVWRQMPEAEIWWLKAIGLDYFDWGRFGVVLFFLISGYVIPLSFSGSSPIRKFLISRAFRLYPAFWLAVLSMVAVLVWTGTSVMPRQVLANLTMAYPLFREPALSGVYWTLIVEMLFYCAALALFICNLLERPIALAGLALLAIASAVIPLLLLRNGFAIPTSLLGYHLSFLLLGSLIRLSLNGVAHARAMMIVLGIALAVTLPLVSGAFGMQGPVYSNALPIGAMASVAAAVAIFLLSWKIKFDRPSPIVLLFGAWSYSIYLFHEVIALGIEQFIHPSSALGAVVFMSTVTLATIAVSALVYRLIEAPSIRLGRHLSSAATKQASATQAA